LAAARDTLDRVRAFIKARPTYNTVSAEKTSDAQFPVDLENARALGKRLVERALEHAQS